MDIYVGIVLLVCALQGALADVPMRLPPSIIRQQEKPVEYYSVSFHVDLICDADGAPEPEYEWYKDGSPWTPQRDVTRTPHSGNLTINTFSYVQEGEYQCFATNRNGRTMSSKFYIAAAQIAKFQTAAPILKTVKIGESVKFNCAKPKSAPPAAISWTAVESLDTNAKSVDITLDQRVQIDDDGNLIFANVIVADHYSGSFYRCSAQNTKAGLSAFGSYVQLAIVPDDQQLNHSPALTAHTGSDVQNGIVIALKRQSISLRCLFSGLPTPSVTWSRADGKNLPRDRIDYAHRKTVLIINNVEDYDEGSYRCTGNGFGSSANKVIPLQVEAIPDFLPNKQPVNFNATDGDDVLFHCLTDAEPPADIIWYMNSEVLTAANMPARVEIESGNTVLRVTNVCKDCKSGSTDLRVYACEASNEHGYAFASGYLNVLLPTVMVTAPQEQKLSFENNISFYCGGTTDDSTPLKVLWLRDGQRFDEITDELFQIDTAAGSTLWILTTKLEEEPARSYLGNFTCIMGNGYSYVNFTAALYDDPAAVPLPPAVKLSSAADLWWLILLLVILLLLAIFLICCCLCLQRNKGDTYPVDEKERKNGNDPEKELAANGYSDYQRPEAQPIVGSRASLNSAMKLDDSDDDASLAEYGDIDTGKFNEDGSFIGEYNTADRRRGDTKV